MSTLRIAEGNEEVSEELEMDDLPKCVDDLPKDSSLPESHGQPTECRRDLSVWFDKFKVDTVKQTVTGLPITRADLCISIAESH